MMTVFTRVRCLSVWVLKSLVASSVLCGSLGAEVAYRLIDLGALEGYPISLAKALNEHGEVVGAGVSTADSKARAVLFDAVDIHDLGSLKGRVSVAKGINKQGVVVGRATLDTPEREMRAFVWTEEDGMRPLRGLGGRFSSASAINDHGVIVGTSDVGCEGRHAVLWAPDKQVRDLGTLGGQFSNAAAINNKGQVVGRSGLESSDSHAFLWTEEAGMRDLGALEGRLSGARGINSHGQVVGYVTDPDDNVMAFVWSEEEGMKAIGVLEEGNFSIANAINDHGVAVGISFSKNFHRAFIWDEANGMWDLNLLIDPCIHWRLHYAVGINNRGEIAGVGQHHGHYSAFLLVPIEQQLDEFESESIAPATPALEPVIEPEPMLEPQKVQDQPPELTIPKKRPRMTAMPEPPLPRTKKI